MRIDTYLFKNGYFRSRSLAAEVVKNGKVFVDGSKILKPSFEINDLLSHSVIIDDNDYTKYVSRGGIKLDAAISSWDIKLYDKTCIDIGASTGGFTDCLLHNGAKKVFSIDIGHDQLSQKLVDDIRVINMEGINARYLTCEMIGEKVNVSVSDVSFISQTMIIPMISNLLVETGIYICLIKPQFECGRNGLNKNGIVINNEFRKKAVLKVVTSCLSNSLCPLDIIRSPIKGKNGNIEFILLSKVYEKDDNIITIERINEIVL